MSGPEAPSDQPASVPPTPLGDATSTPLTPPPPRSFRRWFQFRLITLLIAGPLLAAVVTMLGRYWYRNYAEKRAEKVLEEAGAQLVRDDAGKVTRVYMRGAAFTNQELERLVAHLQSLPKLRELDIVEAPVTDEGLMHLFRLSQLRELYVYDTKATDRGLAKLRDSLPFLEVKVAMPDPVGTSLAMRPIYNHAVTRVAFSPDGKTIYAGVADGTLRAWDAASGKAQASITAHSAWTFADAPHPSGKMVATGGGDATIRFWDAVTLQLIAELHGHDDDVHSIAFDPTGQFLVSSSDDHTVRVWDVAAQQEVNVLLGHEHTIPAVAISPDGRFIASASRDDSVRIWDLSMKQTVHVFHGHEGDVHGVAFSPDGKLLATASYDKTVRLWNVADGSLWHTYVGHDDWVFTVAFEPAGKHLYSGAGDGIRVWSLENLQCEQILGDLKNISSLAFQPQTNLLAAASAEGNVRLLDPARGHASVRTFWVRYGERELTDVLD